MSIKVDGIQSEDELQKAQASAQAQGTSIANYSEWAEILKEFSENGIESTGSYSGDEARLQEIQELTEQYVAQIQAQEQIKQTEPQNKETDKVQKSSETDREQQLKATVVNGTSSQILADYMKFYHLL